MSRPALALRLGALLAIGVVGPAQAGSALRLPVPEHFGVRPAVIWSEDGRAIGRARSSLERRPDGRVEMGFEGRVQGGAGQRLYALLEPVGDGALLRPVRQESRTVDSDGRSLWMRIDHRRGVGECESHDGAVRRLELPDGERIANVPLHLAMRPLAQGRTRRVDFQFLLCRGQGRILDAHGEPARDGPHRRDWIAIDYVFDLGPVLSTLARPFLPRLVFWLSRDDRGAWVGHRMPIHPEGPPVIVLREGVVPADLR